MKSQNAVSGEDNNHRVLVYCFRCILLIQYWPKKGRLSNVMRSLTSTSASVKSHPFSLCANYLISEDSFIYKSICLGFFPLFCLFELFLMVDSSEGCCFRDSLIWQRRSPTLFIFHWDFQWTNFVWRTTTSDFMTEELKIQPIESWEIGRSRGVVQRKLVWLSDWPWAPGHSWLFVKSNCS